MDKQPWWRVVEDIRGRHHLEVSVINQSDDSHPAMVEIEAKGSAVLPDDARRYALVLLAAAEVADARTEAMIQRAMAARGSAVDRSKVLAEVHPGAKNEIEQMAAERGGWVCEQHPDKPWRHDDCAGPGMSRNDEEGSDR